MKNKTYTLRFRAINKDIFDAIRTGRKKVETRAATPKYRKVRAKDKIRFVCGGLKSEKIVKKVKVFKSVSSLLKSYRVRQVNPYVKDGAGLRKMYQSFPGYEEKIKKCGLVAFEL